MAPGHTTHLDDICCLNAKLCEDAMETPDQDVENKDAVVLDKDNIEPSSESEAIETNSLANGELKDGDKGSDESGNATIKEAEKEAQDEQPKKDKMEICPVLLAQRKLRNLEVSIERRYLKPPLARPV